MGIQNHRVLLRLNGAVIVAVAVAVAVVVVAVVIVAADVDLDLDLDVLRPALNPLRPFDRLCGR
jgi:hypothetical protein